MAKLLLPPLGLMRKKVLSEQGEKLRFSFTSWGSLVSECARSLALTGSLVSSVPGGEQRAGCPAELGQHPLLFEAALNSQYSGPASPKQLLLPYYQMEDRPISSSEDEQSHPCWQRHCQPITAPRAQPDRPSPCPPVDRARRNPLPVPVPTASRQSLMLRAKQHYQKCS